MNALDIWAVDHDRKILLKPTAVKSIRQIIKVQGLIALGSEVACVTNVFKKKNTTLATFEWLCSMKLNPNQPNVFNFSEWGDADKDKISPSMGLVIQTPIDPKNKKKSGPGYVYFDGRLTKLSSDLLRRMKEEGYFMYDY